MPLVPNREGVGSVDAECVNAAIQVHARIVRLAIDGSTGNAIRKSIEVRDAAVGIQKSQLCGLTEVDAAPVIRGPCRELIFVGMDGSECCELSGQSEILLKGIAAVGQAIAFFSRLILTQHVGNASPEWKRRIGCVLATGGKSGIPGVGEGDLFGAVRLVERLVGESPESRSFPCGCARNRCCPRAVLSLKLCLAVRLAKDACFCIVRLRINARIVAGQNWMS